MGINLLKHWAVSQTDIKPNSGLNRIFNEESWYKSGQKKVIHFIDLL